MDPKGHAAIVTGAASGLGAETAAQLATAGVKVACLDINLDGAKEVAGKIGGIAIRCDVTSADSAEAALKEARDKHGPARILVNCAGVGPAKRMVGRDGPMPLADFEKVIAVNLIGTFNMMRLAAADMQAVAARRRRARRHRLDRVGRRLRGPDRPGGLCRLQGRRRRADHPVARELSQFGIRVMAIAPGIFGTPMLRALPQAAQDSLGASVPFPKRLGEPREYADLVLFIVRSGYLNGEVIRLDGALRMAPR